MTTKNKNKTDQTEQTEEIDPIDQAKGLELEHQKALVEQSKLNVEERKTHIEQSKLNIEESKMRIEEKKKNVSSNRIEQARRNFEALSKSNLTILNGGSSDDAKKVSEQIYKSIMKNVTIMNEIDTL